MITSTQAAEEAKQSSILTIMALIFVPMSLVANVMSLNGVFQPDGPLFWSYFAISVPLTLVLLIFVMRYRANNVHESQYSVINRLAGLFWLRRKITKQGTDVEMQSEDTERATGQDWNKLKFNNILG
jgi:hypothetical protein